MTDLINQNSPSIDPVVKANDEVLNRVEDMALGFLYQTVSHALGLGALNATTAQQQSNITAQAVTTMGATVLYSIDTASDSLFVNSQKIKAKVQTPMPSTI